MKFSVSSKTTWVDYKTLEFSNEDEFVELMNTKSPVWENASFSMSTWKEGKRSAENWESASGWVFDCDWPKGTGNPPDHAGFLAGSDKPGNAWYITPNGLRIIYLAGEEITSKGIYTLAEEELMRVVESWITKNCPGFEIDKQCVKDFARMYFCPKAKAKDKKREAEVFGTQREMLTGVEEHFKRFYIVDQSNKVEVRNADGRYAKLDEKFYPPGGWDSLGGQCPICGHKGCFTTDKFNDLKWVCRSSNHGYAKGKGDAIGYFSAKVNGYIGGGADVEAFKRGISVEALFDEGEEKQMTTTKVVPIRKGQDDKPSIKTYEVIAEDREIKIRRGEGIDAGLFFIEEGNGKNIRALELILTSPVFFEVIGGKVEYDTKTTELMYGRDRLVDRSYTEIRINIERNFKQVVFHVSGKKETISAITVDSVMLSKAIDFVASKYHSYDPMKELFESVKWDGQKRIEKILECGLGFKKPPRFFQTLIRKWMLGVIGGSFGYSSKTERGILLLIGGQGVGKTQFFVNFAPGDRYMSQTGNPSERDAVLKSLHAILIDFSEMATTTKTDSGTLKSFTTEAIDIVTKKYEKMHVKIKRTFSFCSTTNDDICLTDLTGNRRWWTIPLPADSRRDIPWVKANRDQLWAEAYQAYLANEDPFLTEHEKNVMLPRVQRPFLSVPPWIDDLKRALKDANKVDNASAFRIVGVVGKAQTDLDSLHKLSYCLKELGFEKYKTSNTNWKRSSKYRELTILEDKIETFCEDKDSFKEEELLRYLGVAKLEDVLERKAIELIKSLGYIVGSDGAWLKDE